MKLEPTLCQGHQHSDLPRSEGQKLAAAVGMGWTRPLVEGCDGVIRKIESHFDPYANPN